MRYLYGGVVANLVSSVTCFRDTSPFFLLSTSELLTSSPSLVTASGLYDTVLPQLEKCPSDIYIVVSQPGVNAGDFQQLGQTDTLRRLAEGRDERIRSSLSLKDVKGILDTGSIAAVLQTKCGAQHSRSDPTTTFLSITDIEKPRVIEVDFPALSAGDDRQSKFAQHNAFLDSLLNLVPHAKLTIIYTTSPSTVASTNAYHESELYEMDPIFQNSLHGELKRDSGITEQEDDPSIRLPEGPLFERYAFLSPGLFMGLFVTFILLSILYVAISGVASLQVSYHAFDKETGPQVQKNKAQ